MNEEKNSLQQLKCSLSIVVPLLNESGNIRQLYSEIVDVCTQQDYDYEIIFVDDGSGDNTQEILKGLANENPRCRYLRLKRNFGQTAALAAGLDNAKGSHIVTLDGDLQNDPRDIPKLLQKLEEGYDVVTGWRRKRKDALFSVKLPSMIANAIIRKVTSVRIHDTGCTLRVFRREVLKDLHLYGEMHRFIPALLHWSGAKIAEIEVNHRPRKHGSSKYGFGKLPRVVLDIINVKFLLSYSTRPIQIFGKIGFYTLIVSFFSLLILVYMKLFWQIDMTGNPFLLLTFLLCFIGIQFITMGLLGEINIRIYHESTKKKIYNIAEKP